VERKVKERSSPACDICDIFSREILHWLCDSNEVRTALISGFFDLFGTCLQLVLHNGTNSPTSGERILTEDCIACHAVIENQMIAFAACRY